MTGRIPLISLAIVASSSAALGQATRTFGFGVVAGSPAGVDAKAWVGRFVGFELGAGVVEISPRLTVFTDVELGVVTIGMGGGAFGQVYVGVGVEVRLPVGNGDDRFDAVLVGPIGLDIQLVAPVNLFAELRMGGRVQVDAAQISARLSTLKPMGSYRLVLLGGATPSLTLATLEGSLQLSGSGQWVGSRLRFEGLASAVPERQEALSNLLNIIGRRDGARAIIKVG